MKIHDPAMTFAEGAEPLWERGVQNNQDPYGNAVYQYASEWATRMEAALAAGETVAQCAKRCSFESNDEGCGITVFQYGCVISVLAHCWLHGEELRRWHNLDAQLCDEGERANESGGVLNPAILNLTRSE